MSYYERRLVRRNPMAIKIHYIMALTRALKTGLKSAFMWIFRIRSSDDGTSEVHATVLLAIFFAGVQLAFNFATAIIVQRTPGYGHVNIPLLALLFCSRPRLGWLAWLLSKIPDWVLVHWFYMTDHASLISGQTISKSRCVLRNGRSHHAIIGKLLLRQDSPCWGDPRFLPI